MKINRRNFLKAPVSAGWLALGSRYLQGSTAATGGVPAYEKPLFKLNAASNTEENKHEGEQVLSGGVIPSAQAVAKNYGWDPGRLCGSPVPQGSPRAKAKSY